MQYGTVASYMEACSRSIEHELPLQAARDLMHDLDARYLPVCAGGRCCGVLSARDLQLAWNLCTNKDLTVAQAMSEDFYPVMPNTPIAHVVRTMGIYDYQAALVMAGRAVRGIFSSAHALRALSDVLGTPPEDAENLGAGEARVVILTERMHVCVLLERTRAATREVLASAAPERAVAGLRSRAGQLLLAMKSLLELEDRTLAPVLADLPGYGKERSAQLVSEHRRQTDETQAIVRALAQRNTPPVVLAHRLEERITGLEAALAREEELLLNLDLLRDDGIVTECTAG